MSHEDKLEYDRYDSLLELFTQLSRNGFDDYNSKLDAYHDPVTKWNNYILTLEGDPLNIKMLRNLQLINRCAHNYQVSFKTIIYGLFKDKRIQQRQISKFIDLFSKDANIRGIAEKKLSRTFDATQLEKIKSNEGLQIAATAYNWLMEQKCNYILKTAEILQTSNPENINYGLSYDDKNNRTIIYDVPQYGQFSLHFGKRTGELVPLLEELRSSRV